MPSEDLSAGPSFSSSMYDYLFKAKNISTANPSSSTRRRGGRSHNSSDNNSGWRRCLQLQIFRPTFMYHRVTHFESQWSRPWTANTSTASSARNIRKQKQQADWLTSYRTRLWCHRPLQSLLAHSLTCVLPFNTHRQWKNAMNTNGHLIFRRSTQSFSLYDIWAI